MFDFGGMPDIFWIFAGIALIILAQGYVKSQHKQASTPEAVQKDLAAIKERLDHIETHLDLRG